MVDMNPMATPAAVERFAANDCKSDTGHAPETLMHIWAKYNNWGGSATGSFGAQLPPVRSLEQRAFYLFLVYVKIHKCPQSGWGESYRSRDGRFRASPRVVRDQVHLLAHALGLIIDEVDRTRREDAYNHGIPPFNYLFTGMVDTLPVYVPHPVPHPHKFSLQRFLYQPKYKATVLKWELGITFAGEIILFDGPHLGTPR